MLTADDRDLFLALRARQLAALWLTRRHEVVVESEPPGFRLDLLASVLEDDRESGRVFGVETQAVDAASDSGGEIATTAQTRLSHAPFPVCLFVFTMHDDVGRWRWLREPVLTPNDKRSLAAVPEGPLLPLTDEAVSSLIAQVRGWYRVWGF